MMEAIAGSAAARRAFVPNDHHRRARLQIHSCPWSRPRLPPSGICSRFSTQKPPRVAAFAAAADADAEETQRLPADDPVLPVVSTTFVLERRCEYGESFVVAGDHELLGAWDPDSALTMTWTEGHVWKCEIDLPAEKEYEYKFVLTGKDAKPDWQPGPNRKFSTRESPVIVSESWEDVEGEAGTDADAESRAEAEAESAATGQETLADAGADDSLGEEKGELTVDNLETMDEVGADGTNSGAGEAGALETEDEAGETKEDDLNEPVVAPAPVEAREKVTPPLTWSSKNEPVTVEGVATELTTSGSGSGTISDEGAVENEVISAVQSPPAEKASSSGKVTVEDSKGFKIFRFHKQEEPGQKNNGQREVEVPFLEAALANTLLKGDNDEKSSGG